MLSTTNREIGNSMGEVETTNHTLPLESCGQGVPNEIKSNRVNVRVKTHTKSKNSQLFWWIGMESGMSMKQSKFKILQWQVKIHGDHKANTSQSTREEI